MEEIAFDNWLSGLDLSYWATAKHKIGPAAFLERQVEEGAVLLDVRSREEAQYLTFPSALHIPVDELPKRWREVPRDRLVATFCSSATRAVVAWVYLQLRGFENVRILEAPYDGLTAELKPGPLYKRVMR